MFFFKVSCIFLKIFIFFILLETCFTWVQIGEQIFEPNQESKTGFADISRDTIGNLPEKTAASSMEKNPFVYRRQNLNESMEKIQITNNGIVKKTTYIPVLPKHSSVTFFDKLIENGMSDCEGNGSVCWVKPKLTFNVHRENFVTKNGKKYRVIKVMKSYKNYTKNQIQRRTFKPSSNLISSILPLHWLTRQNKNETESKTRSKNTTQWSKLLPIESQEENSKEILKDGVHSSEKIKKLLNLFTIVKFDNGECYADGIKGTCLHPLECEAKGGKSVATCAEELGVCCYSEKTCGDTSNDTISYFINEGFPDSSTVAPKVCTLIMKKRNPDVKQLRLDFLIFQLREPTNGTCLHDRLVISGQDMNDVVPEICGSNSGQHIYVDVGESSGPFILNIVTMGEYFPRNFRIKVTQVKKNDVLLAPKNCLQYYSEPAGYVQTFNYQQNIYEHVNEVVNGYLNNLNYAICIKKQKGFCSITYENEEIDTKHPTFQLVNVDEDGERLLPQRQAGAETFDCPDDYIIISGIRLCGEKLNDASVDTDYTRNYPVTDTTNGPFILLVRTDATVSGRGFNLKYIQNPCLT